MLSPITPLFTFMLRGWEDRHITKVGDRLLSGLKWFPRSVLPSSLIPPSHEL